MSESETRIDRHRGAFRFGLGALGAIQFINGVWAVLAPRSFYGDFPLGRGWVEALPAYNEHLMRDVGALFLATGLILLLAAWLLERRLTAIAIVSYLLFAVPHAIYHAFNLEPYATGDAIGNMVALAATVVLPIWLLIELRRTPHAAAATRRTVATGGADANGRIAGVPEDTRSPLVRAAYRESRRRYGAVLDPMRIYAHHPAIFAGYAAMETAAERTHKVDDRLKHLAEMRAAMVPGCEWCCDFGSSISKQKSISEEEMRELPAYQSSDLFNEVETLVLDYATGMSRSPVEVSDELFASLRQHFDEAQLVELTNIIALENYRARFNWAFGIESQGFSEGTFCVRPEAASAASRAGGGVA